MSGTIGPPRRDFVEDNYPPQQPRKKPKKPLKMGEVQVSEVGEIIVQGSESPIQKDISKRQVSKNTPIIASDEMRRKAVFRSLLSSIKKLREPIRKEIPSEIEKMRAQGILHEQSKAAKEGAFVPLKDSVALKIP